MTTLQTKNFDTLVSDQAAAIQGGTIRYLLDFTVGSILRAVVEAFAAVTMWLQGLILQVLATTRAASSTGTDLDTWMADYNIVRLPAVTATGSVTFSRFTPTLRTIIPVGTIVQTTDGASSYTVTTDTTNVNYSAVDGGYILAAGITSVVVPIIANLAGAAANVGSGAVSTMTQAIAGVDYVRNVLAVTNGVNAESDTQLRARFVAYIASLAKATRSAVAYAISTVSTVLTYTLVENQTYAGVTQYGYFYVVVDDGTGVPSSTVLTNVASAIDVVRPVTVPTFGVFAPVIVNATVTMTITTAPGYNHATATVAVAAALTAYINALPLGTALSYTRLTQVAYDATLGITNILAVLLNAATSDLPATTSQVIKTSSVVVL